VRLLGRYLLMRLLRGYVVVGLSLAALLWLLEMLRLLERAGGGGMVVFELGWQAARVLPESMVDLLPVVVVLATSAVMGTLNRDQEITAMRAAGVPLARISLVALVPAAGLALLALAMLQWGTPLLYQGPTRIASSQLGEEGLWHPSHGIWLRQDRAFLNVATLELGRVPADLEIFEFDANGRLARQISAARARTDLPDGWHLEDAVVRTFPAAGGRELETVPDFLWRSFLSAAELELLLRPPASLPLTDLWQYLASLRAQQRDTSEFVLVLARRLVLPLACIGMALVAMAAAVATLRSSAASLRVGAAMAIGLGYHLLTEMFSFAALVAGWPVVPVAVLPPLLLAAFGGWLLKQAR
jgi:lipopolysaccharide export system permease protein